jgi:hypothetical protein
LFSISCGRSGFFSCCDSEIVTREGAILPKSIENKCLAGDERWREAEEAGEANEAEEEKEAKEADETREAPEAIAGKGARETEEEEGRKCVSERGRRTGDATMGTRCV